jgi:hypothetical protein
LLAPISFTVKGDGVLVQAGSNRTESLIAAELDGEALEDLRQTSRFRPRQQMNLGSLGPVLAEMYGQGLTVEGAIAQGLAGAVEAEPAWIGVEPEVPEVPVTAEEPAAAQEPAAEGVEEEPAFSRVSVPEAMSLGGPETPEEEA